MAEIHRSRARRPTRITPIREGFDSQKMRHFRAGTKCRRAFLNRLYKRRHKKGYKVVRQR